MGQEQSSGVIVNGQLPQRRTCRPCGDWGNKDYNTVKVDTAALKKSAFDKENAPNGNKNVVNKEEAERQRKIQEWERQQEKVRREEEERKEMERRVKEEQERQLAEQRRREAERRRLELEQQAREREAKERHEREMHEAQLKQERLEKEQQEQIRLQDEARQRKIKEVEDEKKLRAFLQSNGFKNPNDIARKKWTKVTPLHFAVGQNNVEMVKLLLAAGADPKKVSGKSETPLRLAQKLDKSGTHHAIVQELTPVTMC